MDEKPPTELTERPHDAEHALRQRPQVDKDDISEFYRLKTEQICREYLRQFALYAIAIVGVVIAVLGLFVYQTTKSTAATIAQSSAQEKVNALTEGIEERSDRLLSDVEESVFNLRVDFGQKRAEIDQTLTSVRGQASEAKTLAEETLLDSKAAKASASRASREAALANEEAARAIFRAQQISRVLEDRNIDQLVRAVEEQPEKVAELLQSNPEFMREISSHLVRIPIGTVIAVSAASSSVPEGWLVADGRLLLAEEYPELFNTIGLLYSRAGDDPGSFRLPDLRGLTLVGANESVGRVFGSAEHRHTIDHAHQVPKHRVQVSLTGTTSPATFHDRESRRHGGDPDDLTSLPNGSFIYTADEDTISLARSQHRHEVGLDGEVTVPGSTLSLTGDHRSGVASSYQPSIEVRMLIRAR